MNETYTAAHSSAPTAQEFMRALREAFDVRSPVLGAEAMRVLQEGPTVGLAHVVFPFHGLIVTAVYNAHEQRFTQLLARDVGELVTERPSYTLSLFL